MSGGLPFFRCQAGYSIPLRGTSARFQRGVIQVGFSLMGQGPICLINRKAAPRGTAFCENVLSHRTYWQALDSGLPPPPSRVN